MNPATRLLVGKGLAWFRAQPDFQKCFKDCPNNLKVAQKAVILYTFGSSSALALGLKSKRSTFLVGVLPGTDVNPEP